MLKPIWCVGDLRRAKAACERLVLIAGEEFPAERRDLAVILLHCGFLPQVIYVGPGGDLAFCIWEHGRDFAFCLLSCKLAQSMQDVGILYFACHSAFCPVISSAMGAEACFENFILMLCSFLPVVSMYWVHQMFTQPVYTLLSKAQKQFKQLRHNRLSNNRLSHMHHPPRIVKDERCEAHLLRMLVEHSLAFRRVTHIYLATVSAGCLFNSACCDNAHMQQN